jgi:hypothetical protein
MSRLVVPARQATSKLTPELLKSLKIRALERTPQLGS